MDRPPPDQLYEPLPRIGHVTVEVGGRVYTCSGSAGSRQHHSPSLIEVFDPETGLWHQQPTTGEIPPEVNGCAYATIGSKLIVFGGYDGSSHHNSLHELDLSTMVWREVRPRNSSDGPQRKSHGRMVEYGEHCLVMFGGLTSSGNRTDELHVLNLKEGTWSSPHVSGTPPPPCSSFSLTKTDEHHAVMFGGKVGRRAWVNDVYLLYMQNWHWTKVTTSGPSSQDPRESHAACCIAGPLLGSLSPQLFVTGGRGKSAIADAWALDLQSRTWMKVDIPDGVSQRFGHTLTVVSSGPTSVQLVEFGGRRQLIGGDPIAATVVLQLEVDKDQSQAGGPLVWRVAGVATTDEPQRWKQRLELLQKLTVPDDVDPVMALCCLSDKPTQHIWCGQEMPSDQEVMTIAPPQSVARGESRISLDNVDDTQLDDSSLFDVMRELLGVTRWFDLGLALGLKYRPTLESIKIENRERVSDCKRDMIQAWLEMQYDFSRMGLPSWRTLVAALMDPIVDYADIAQNIASKHPK